MPYGLSEEIVNQIKGTFADFPDVDEVTLIGSRAKGTQKEGSDIDFVLMGDISHKKLLSIKSVLNGLNYPYTFDVIIHSNIKKDALKEHINRVGVSLYTNQRTKKSH